MSHCREGMCPFEDKFPEDCPGSECWLRKAQRPLSEKQERALSGVLEGKLNKQIAYEMGVSTDAVKRLLHEVYLKYGVTTRTQCVLKVLGKI